MLGHRLLKVHLLSPSADLEEIQNRLDLVEFFKNEPDLSEYWN